MAPPVFARARGHPRRKHRRLFQTDHSPVTLKHPFTDSYVDLGEEDDWTKAQPGMSDEEEEDADADADGKKRKKGGKDDSKDAKRAKKPRWTNAISSAWPTCSPRTPPPSPRAASSAPQPPTRPPPSRRRTRTPSSRTSSAVSAAHPPGSNLREAGGSAPRTSSGARLPTRSPPAFRPPPRRS